MIVRDIASAIEEFAPLNIQESWDNSGLCIGSLEQEVHGVLLGFDCTPALVDEAVACGADMIVTHHPLLFNGLKKVNPADPVALTLMKAVSAGIAVYACHTNADKVLAGVSGAMARRLGLNDVQVLEADADGNGLGAVGVLPQPVSAAEFVNILKEKFSLDFVRTSKPLTQNISKVAMCGGSGSSLIENAISSGAQAYITGDVSYHHFFTPDGFMIFDIGHYEGEVEIVNILFSLLKKKFPTFVVRTSVNLASSNPVYYY